MLFCHEESTFQSHFALSQNYGAEYKSVGESSAAGNRNRNSQLFVVCIIKAKSSTAEKA